MQEGLEVQFMASGGHPVLLAQRSGYPTLLHNDFLFRCLHVLPPVFPDAQPLYRIKTISV